LAVRRLAAGIPLIGSLESDLQRLTLILRVHLSRELHETLEGYFRACVQLGGHGTRTDQNQRWNAVVRLTRFCGRDSQIRNCVIHEWSA